MVINILNIVLQKWVSPFPRLSPIIQCLSVLEYIVSVDVCQISLLSATKAQVTLSVKVLLSCNCIHLFNMSVRITIFNRDILVWGLKSYIFLPDWVGSIVTVILNVDGRTCEKHEASAFNGAEKGKDQALVDALLIVVWLAHVHELVLNLA